MSDSPHDVEVAHSLAGFESPTPRLPDPQVIAAINALKDKDFSKLQVCAVALFYRIRYLAHDKNADDLLNEAIVRTLNSDRNWKPDRVHFVPYLIRTMESIVYNWRQLYLRFPLTPFDENVTSSESSQLEEEEVCARDHEATLRAYFQDDPEAWNVLDLKMDGYTPVKIREELKLSLHAYNAAAKRGRRRAQAFALELARTERFKHGGFGKKR